MRTRLNFYLALCIPPSHAQIFSLILHKTLRLLKPKRQNLFIYDALWINDIKFPAQSPWITINSNPTWNISKIPHSTSHRTLPEMFCPFAVLINIFFSLVKWIWNQLKWDLGHLITLKIGSPYGATEPHQISLFWIVNLSLHCCDNARGIKMHRKQYTRNDISSWSMLYGFLVNKSKQETDAIYRFAGEHF